MGCGTAKTAGKPEKLAKTSQNPEKISANALLGGRIEDYELQGLINVGRKSEVFRAIHRISKEIRAIKRYKLSELDETDVSRIKEQISIISRLKHPNIIQCFDMFVDGVFLYVVFELCEGGELFDRVLEAKKAFSENELAIIARQLLLALNYCHELNIIHRDLKSSSILFKSPSSNDFSLKILVFSYSKAFRKQTHKEFSFQKTQPTYHLSPEALLLEAETKGDLWSCGILLYFLAFCKHPFEDLQTKDQEVQFPEGIAKEMSTEFMDFLKKLLEKDTSKRFSAKEALQSPWIRKLEAKALSFTVSAQVFEEFKKIYNRYKLQDLAWEFVYRNLALEEEKRKMQELFEKFDKDHNGFIEKNEFFQGIKELYGDSMSPQEIEALFEKFDSDKNQKINYQEFSSNFCGFQRNLDKERLEKAFKMLDIDQNGLISLNEFKEKFVIEGKREFCEDKWKTLIERVDLNGDLQISLEEFKLLFY